MGIIFTSKHQIGSIRKKALVWALALPILFFISRSNFNLFHTLSDGISIVIAVCIFTIIWNSRRLLDNNYFLFTGIAFLFFAFMDSIHLLGNKGMGVFPEYGNLGPTFYIAGRYVLSISLLLAPLFIRRKLNTALMFAAYGLATLLVLFSVFYWNIFPVCIVEGVGLTPFKIISDGIICLILVGAIGLLLRNRESFDSGVLRLIVSSISLSIASGLIFTLYKDPFGLTNVLGHFFQIGSFYLAYIGFVITSVTNPQEILYRKLKQHEEALAEKVRELDHANADLQQEIRERGKTEQLLLESEARYRLLSKTAGRLLDAYDPQAIVEDLCRDVMAHLDCQTFFNFLANGNSGRLRLNACAGIPEEDVRTLEWLDYGVAVCGCVAQGKERIIAEDIFNTSDPRTDLVKSYGIQAYCCHPLMAEDRLIGTLSFGTKTRAHFTPKEVELMRIVADQVAIAMERQQTAKSLKERTVQLETANQDLESFSYSVSHDLRAPLRTIDGFSKMVLRDLGDKFDAESRRKLNVVRENTEKMNRLIDDLLNLSRLGRQALNSFPLDMNKLFREAWEELYQPDPERNVRFDLGDLYEVRGDRALMKQVVLNLLSNALKYSRNRNPAEIEIRSTKGDDSVVFSVKDNGAGFDMSLYDKLFGVFRRLHRQSEFEGTGVGLAIVHRIIHRHDGKVWAEGEVGKGAIFYFSLPNP